MTDRHPRWVYEAGAEPDPRYTLANERTFLAWVRTALGLVAGGVALHALGLPDPKWVRAVLAIALVLLGGALCVFAMARWARVERSMRTGEALPAFSLGYVLTGVMVVISMLVALAIAVA